MEKAQGTPHLKSRCLHKPLTTNRSAIAEEALEFFRLLYDVERDAQNLTSDERRRLRQEMAVPIAKTLKAWLEAQRARVPDGSAIAKATHPAR